MKRTFQSFILVTSLISCVPKSDYDKLKNENNELKTEIQRHKLEKQKEEERLKELVHTEEEALRLVADYYEFYNSNMKYKNPKIRRTSNDSFQVSVQECLKKTGYCDNETFWNSKVLTLTINKDKSYKVEKLS